jgi:hypothetical protein
VRSMRFGRRNDRVILGTAAALACLLALARSGEVRAAAEPPQPVRESPVSETALAPARNAPAPAAPATAAPSVRQVEPNQLTAGQSYALSLSGTNLQPTMQLDLGAGIVIQKALIVTDTSHAQVWVLVVPDTPPGRHLVTVSFVPRATLSAAPAMKTQGPGYVDVVVPAATGPVVLDTLSPREVQQGQQATLMLHGSGFRTGMALSFGPGITAGGPVQVQSQSQATVPIQVSPQAPAMLRHPTLLLAGRDVRVSPEATLTVAAASPVVRPTPKPIELASVPVVLAVAPARIFTGQSYTLTLRGVNLVPQLQVDLGPGIVPSGGLRIQSPSLATLEINVQDGAAPGMRWLGLQVPSALTSLRQDASVLVQRSVALPPQAFRPRPTECKQPKVPHPGTIVLDGPLYTGTMSDVGGTFNVPVLNDQTNLTWHDANPGLVDRYEVRFYSGSTLISTRALTAAPGYALPHNLSPDAALIAELTSKVAGRVAKIVNQHPASPPAIAWDLSWQVVGFRTYYDSCISPAATVAASGGRLIEKAALGQGTEREVARSEAVPIKQPQTGDPLLDLPTAPTGMSCSAAPPGMRQLRMRGSPAAAPPPWANPTLTLSNTSRASQGVVLLPIGPTKNPKPAGPPTGRTATADYIGDHWQFSGSLDLSNAPWAMTSQRSVNTSQAQYPVETEALNNVFVDWGDGTVEPLTVQWHGQYCAGVPCFASNTETSTATDFDLDAATNQGAFGHAYNQVGSFEVRVYMLPASAVQQQGALPMSLKAGSGGLYGRLLSRVGQVPSGPSSNGDLAYMPFCQAINIQHRTDPVSNGPLQLIDIQIAGFPDAPPSALMHGIIETVPRGSAPPAKPPERLHAHAGIASGGAPAAAIPQFSSCDVSLVGGATLDFLGQGTVKLTWYQDGKVVGSSEEPVGPSTSRTDAQLAPPHPADPIKTAWLGLHSPALSLAQGQIGQHSLWVTAEVVQDAHPLGRALGTLGNFASVGTLPVQQLHSGALSGAPPLGLLGPRAAATAGLPPIQWVNQAPTGAPGASLHIGLGDGLPIGDIKPGGNPPNEVISTPSPYETTSADPALPCTFNFPVTGGSFVVSGLQHGGKATVQQQGSKYSGTGVLQARFADASGTSTQPEPVSIHLQGWTMQSDNVTVASGSFDESPAPSPLHVPGLTASLDRIAGTAGGHVSATLSASLVNTEIAATSGSPPPPWKGVAATLSPQGDWYADQLPMPALLIYDSGFSLTAANVTLDLSESEGQGADPLCKGGGGKSWMGVRLNQAKLTAFNFDLPNPPTTAAGGWALDSYGFCGSASFPSGTATIDRGSLSWSGIATSASRGSFSANYNGLKVHVPWLNVDLTSPQATTVLTAGHGAGQGGINLNLTSPSKVTLNEGAITLTASNLSFASIPNSGGWAVKSDTTLSFKALDGQFASGVVLHGFDFGMNGSGSFADGSSSRHISLSGQKGSIGGSLVDLKSVDVQVGPPSSTTRLSFAFDSTLNLSKTLPAADVAVSYSISEPSSGTYVGTGPLTSPFKLDKPFPDAIPSVHLSMTPTYVGSTAGGARGNSGILFSSSLDLGMFGGPPVSGQFVLGYVGSDDYWLAKAVLDLGPTGVAIVPPVINLYQVGGGMGYNVTLDSFKNSDLRGATPQDDGQLLLDVTLLIGSPDHTTFGLVGDFVIKPGGQDPGGRMDYHAWLLDPNWSGQSPIYGYFSYSGGVFDGTLNAQYSLLNGQIALDATNNAIHMHVGGGQWYYHFGTENSPLNGHVFAFNGQAWADLGSDGFGLGLKARLDVKAGDCSGACAYINDDWTLTAAITPSPLSFSASAGQNFDLGACADGFCLNANAGVGMSMSLPPPYLNFNFQLGGCPPGHINVGLQVLPSLNGNVGGNACL